MQQLLPALRSVVAAAVSAGIPVPALAASLAWYDSWQAAVLPVNLVQAQRDAFGAHGFRRLPGAGEGSAADAPLEHADWQGQA